MKIIAFGDIHMATAEAGKIPGIKEADLVLLTGDLTNYGDAKEARLVQGKVCLIGVGGSNFTPFNTPSEFPEQELLRLAGDAFVQGLEFTSLALPLHNRKIPLILVSHVPPYNTTVDTLRNGKHVGSKAIRAIIEQYQPDLCISGHIHEAKGQDTIYNTPVYNHGMLRQGGWITLQISPSRLEITLQ